MSTRGVWFGSMPFLVFFVRIRGFQTADLRSFTYSIAVLYICIDSVEWHLEPAERVVL